MMNNPGFYKFPRFTVAVYFTYFESIKVYRSTRRACSLSKKAFKTSAFGSSEPLLLLRLNGRVGAIPTYRVYRLYDTCLANLKFYKHMYMYMYKSIPLHNSLRCMLRKARATRQKQHTTTCPNTACLRWI